MERPAFLSQKPPPGYVAGIGRGATGFTTRSDIGSGKNPSRVADDREQRVEQSGPEETEHVDGKAGISRNQRFEDPNGLSLDSRTSEPDDKDADRIYDEIEARLARRRVHKKLDIENTSPSKSREGFLAASQQFVDLKRSLATVSEEQWDNLPEAGDITKRNKRQRLEMQDERKSYAAPDALISGNIDLTKLTQEREKLLGRQLDENLSSTATDSNDAKDAVEKYLEELDNSTHLANLDEQAQDLRKMRAILVSYRKADPKKPQGWIASARLEEKANKFRLAKNLIEEGCNQCPYDANIWLENIRLNSSDLHYCKIIVANALQFNEESLALWLKAIDLERERLNKIRVLRKAIQSIPTSEDLWKLAVQYEDDKQEAIKILKKATELLPHSMPLITALVNLEEHAAARQTLNLARRKNPTTLHVWLLALQLEERYNKASVDKLVKLALKGAAELSKNGRTIPFEQWLREAVKIELEFPKLYNNTMQAVVEASVQLFHSSETLSELIEVIEDTTSQCPNTKRSAYSCLLKRDPLNMTMWTKVIKLCQAQSKLEEAYQLFEELLFSDSSEVLRQNSVLALMYSKLLWKSGSGTEKAIEVIDKSLGLVPLNVEFWLAKAKLLVVANKLEAAENLYKEGTIKLSRQPGSERVFYRYINFLRFQKRDKEALRLLETDFLQRAPRCEKLYLQWGQIYTHLGDLPQAQKCFAIGAKNLPTSSNLWIALANADIDQAGSAKARSDYDVALLKVPREKSEKVLVARIHLEKRLENLDQARLLVTQALREFPTSSLLWVEHLRLINKKSLRKTAYQDALKSTNSDPRVLVEIGHHLFGESSYEKALKWFQRAASANPLYGDAWVWIYRCYKKLKRDASLIFSEVEDAEPRYGSEWVRISKDVNNLTLSPSQILAQCASRDN
ncbi:LAQU0S03e05776g1_1 [Lachancea quebecensis]|uniref:LAQU0S03e05776g1_1 n=1 Tax=Lachancea quebecensis TaxID=1654605 RepID=A0A0P1KPU3_9SACH|nr:LAQU0S03e05776g1_1 [Lachancea quebecensis]